MSTLPKTITAPVAPQLKEFRDIFQASLGERPGLLGQVLSHVLQRQGKAMRPILTLLVARALYTKAHGTLARSAAALTAAVGARRPTYDKALHAACALELLHTASLLHDDVVDEAGERRGQPSANAAYGNKIAVLVGDYILSASITEAMRCHDARITEALGRLGATLAEGEVRQQEAIGSDDFSQDRYFDVISRKTAALFEACCLVAAVGVGAREEDIEAACRFGNTLGVIFQMRDDIFDYTQSTAIGKPTGNDMREGKLTLPALFVLQDPQCPEAVTEAARRVRRLQATDQDIALLVRHTAERGGLNHARQRMDEYAAQARQYIATIPDRSTAQALDAYLAFVIDREL